MEALQSNNNQIYLRFIDVNSKVDSVYKSIKYGNEGHPLYGMSALVSNIATLKLAESNLKSACASLSEPSSNLTRSEVAAYEGEKDCLQVKIQLLLGVLTSNTKCIDSYPISQFTTELNRATQDHIDFAHFLKQYIQQIYVEDFIDEDHHIKDIPSFEPFYPRRDVLREVILHSSNLNKREIRKLSRLISRPYNPENFTTEKLTNIHSQLQRSLETFKNEPGATIFSKEIAVTVDRLKCYDELKTYDEPFKDFEVIPND